jgi:ribonuclease G
MDVAAALRPALKEAKVSEEILINVTPRETRVALVENGMLQELHIERASRRGVVGNVYKGRVQRVMPGMQAAFVELGLERAAFLHASDILRVPQEPPEAGVVEGSAETPPPPQPTPSISSLVHEGQEIVVQVVKDPIGSKGARLTTQISIPSRYLVLLPYSRVIGVSARIEDEAERARLKAIMAGWSTAAAWATSCAPTPRGRAPRRWPRTSPTCSAPGS